MLSTGENDIHLEYCFPHAQSMYTAVGFVTLLTVASAAVDYTKPYNVSYNIVRRIFPHSPQEAIYWVRKSNYWKTVASLAY